MIVVEGRRTREADGLPSGYDRVLVDLGTGDGRHAYGLAGERPDWLVVGVDAISEPMAELSAKASRKPAKGGRPNLVYVRASAEQPPPELRGRADEVHVVLPWGALLAGTLLPRPDVLGGIVALARPAGARLSLVLNAEPWLESTPKDMAELPAVTVEHVDRALAPAYAEAGIVLGPARLVGRAEVDALNSTWAKRLAASHGGHPRFVAVEGEVRPRP